MNWPLDFRRKLIYISLDIDSIKRSHTSTTKMVSLAQQVDHTHELPSLELSGVWEPTYSLSFEEAH